MKIIWRQNSLRLKMRHLKLCLGDNSYFWKLIGSQCIVCMLRRWMMKICGGTSWRPWVMRKSTWCLMGSSRSMVPSSLVTWLHNRRPQLTKVLPLITERVNIRVFTSSLPLLKSKPSRNGKIITKSKAWTTLIITSSQDTCQGNQEWTWEPRISISSNSKSSLRYTKRPVPRTRQIPKTFTSLWNTLSLRRMSRQMEIMSPWSVISWRSTNWTWLRFQKSLQIFSQMKKRRRAGKCQAGRKYFLGVQNHWSITMCGVVMIGQSFKLTTKIKVFVSFGLLPVFWNGHLVHQMTLM